MLQSRRFASIPSRHPFAMPIRVDSEIGRLRRVLLQRPGREIDWMVPSMMEQLLFDDILDGEEARQEHDSFRRLLELADVEVLDARTLLEEVLASDDVRGGLVEYLAAYPGAPPVLGRHLAGLGPEALAGAAITGLRLHAPESPPSFDLPPVPNYFFQRDPQVVFGDQVMISSMATAARGREPRLARLIFERHPALAGWGHLFEIEHPGSWPVGHHSRSHFPTLEGGDVLVADGRTLLVGISERTNRRGVEVLAEHLRRREPFLNLLLVELPPRRSYMHLDTVFTFIDHGVCLAYLPVIHGRGMEVAAVYEVDLTARSLTFTLREALLPTLAGLGIELEAVPCGGAADLIDQQREQWTDGANAFAVAPGVIFLYRRNRRTLDELSRQGWRVVGEEEVLAGDEPLLGAGRTVVTLLGNELSRARGGPRCMTMPLEREGL